MDPSRNEMPDIDIDICQDGRAKVIDYVRKKYGHVAQIITFGTLAAKAACKDVGRVLGVPLADVDKLTKLIPGVPGMTLDKAMKQVPELDDLYRSNPTIKQVIDLGKSLEGLCRNAGVHAAGVIIADQPLDEIAVLPFVRSELLEHRRRHRIGQVLGQLLEDLVRLDGVLEDAGELLMGEACLIRCFHCGHSVPHSIFATLTTTSPSSFA
jgi:DNA polymerase-3 subunit alpha